MSDKVSPALRQRAATGQATLAIVQLDEGVDDTSTALTADGVVWTKDELEARAARLAGLRQAVQAVAPTAVDVRPLVHVPLLVLEVKDEATLDALAGSPHVRRISEDVTHEATMTESLNLIGQPGVAAAGFTGAGTAVAVLDTGLDYRNAAFGTCTAPGTPASCRVPFVRDFATNDNALDANGHGTNVAGIVAGVAPGAKILGLDVFNGSGAMSSDIIAAIDWCVQNRDVYGIVAINMSLGGGSASAPCASDAFASAITTAKNAGILSAVASGNNGFTSMLASPACVPDAVSVGAVYDSNRGAMGFSVCSDSTTAADKVTCFSNSASFLTVLAPGSSITAAGITMSGTSQAAPHVAGAIAVLASKYPSEAAGMRLERLVSTGVPVKDARNGVTKPRIDLSAATTGCSYVVSPASSALTRTAGSVSFQVTTTSSCAWTAKANASWLKVESGVTGTGPGTVIVAVEANNGAARSGSVSVAGKTLPVSQSGDLSPPTGTITLAGGDSWTSKTQVAVGLAAFDDVAVTQMCLSATTTCTAWMPYASTATFTLPSGDGLKTVRAWFKDAAGNDSGAQLDTISLDSAAPTGGSLTATRGNGRVNLSWSGFADTASGVAGYTVVMGVGTAPASCTGTGTMVVTPLTTGTTQSVGGLTNGTTYGFRVCAKDLAGNTSSGVTVTAMPAPEFDGPTNGAVSINGGAEWTKSTVVLLALSASDGTSIAQMCISNTTTCTAWQAFANTVSWTLTGGSGPRTVSVWFRDPWGNVSAAAATDSINLDTVTPTGGALTATRGNGQVTLAWSGFTDANSGLAGYTVVMAPATAPTSCASTGTVVTALTSSTTAVVTGLSNGTTYGFRVCAKDIAGNLSTGVAASAMPAPELNGPTSGAVVINGGAEWAKSTAATLTLSASDETSVAQVCISNSTTCTTWQAFAPTVSWTLAAGTGPSTVSVWFRDPWGNVSAIAATDAIKLDTVAPTGGAVTATRGNGQVALSWSGFTDATSGLAGATVVMAPTAAPTSCTSGGTVVTALTTGSSQVVTGLTNGTTYGFRVCPRDIAGNLSTGVAVTAMPAPELNGPTGGAVVINGGAEWAKSATVTLTLSASDETSVAQVCISNATTCTTWQAFAPTVSWALTAGSGARTVSVWFRDPWGNVSAAAATDGIKLDTTAPAGGTLTAVAGRGQVSLSWGGVTDAASGLAGYTLLGAVGTTAPSCGAAGALAQGTATTFVHAGLTAGQRVTYRLCAVDVAGNVSTGLTASAVAQ